MRVLLFTGKGGAGTTTCAAATAAHVAASGRKTLLLSAAGSLWDICGANVGAGPVEIAGGMYAAAVDSQREFGPAWGEVQHALHTLVATGLAQTPDDNELAVLPGVEQLLVLFEVHSQVASGRWEAIVLDCGPVAEAVRLLALPAVLSSYLKRLVPLPPKGRSTRPVGDRPAAGDSTAPRARMFDAIVALHAQLTAVTEVLTDTRTTSVRLVLTTTSVATSEAARAITALSLHGYAVDGVLVNNVPPGQLTANGDPVARGQLWPITEALAPYAIIPVRSLVSEPIGVNKVRELGARIYVDDDPVAVSPAPPALQLDRVAAGYVLSLALPFVRRDEIDVIRRGDEVVVTVHGQRRALTLPSVLRRCVVTNAALANGRLSLDFTPDPDLWLRS